MTKPKTLEPAVKNNAQICLQVWQNKVCTGQESALDYAAAEDGASVKGGVAAREALEGWSILLSTGHVFLHLKMLHTHVLLAAPLGSGDMTQSGTD